MNSETETNLKAAELLGRLNTKIIDNEVFVLIPPQGVHMKMALYINGKYYVKLDIYKRDMLASWWVVQVVKALGEKKGVDIIHRGEIWMYTRYLSGFFKKYEHAVAAAVNEVMK